MDTSGQPVKPTTSVKLVLLGEAAVGKSSLVLRFVSDDFQENKEPTIGAAFLTQKCSLPEHTVKFEIWDTAGQERFASLAPMYYRNAQSALVVYDVTKPQSFVKARHWVNELKAQASPGIVIALVGNKCDLANSGSDEDATNTEGNTSEGSEQSTSESNTNESDARKVATEDGRKLAQDEGLLFFETSAKTGQNVRQVFLAIANKIPRDAPKKPGQTRDQSERVDLQGSYQAQSQSSACAC